MIKLIQLTEATQGFLVEEDVRHVAASLRPVETVGDLHNVPATDFVKLDLIVLDVILFEQISRFRAEWARVCTEHGCLFLLNQL